MKSKRQVGIVMDNGGGIAMAVYNKKYACLSDDGKQVASMLTAVMDGDDTGDWDNNQWGQGVMSVDQQTRAYYGTAYQVARAIVRDYQEDNIYGANHKNLAIALIAAHARGGW